MLQDVFIFFFLPSVFGRGMRLDLARNIPRDCFRFVRATIYSGTFAPKRQRKSRVQKFYVNCFTKFYINYKIAEYAKNSATISFIRAIKPYNFCGSCSLQ